MAFRTTRSTPKARFTMVRGYSSGSSLSRFGGALAALLLCLGPGTAAADRAPGQTHKPPVAPEGVGGAISVQYATAAELINCIAGPNIAISNATFSGSPRAAGKFTGGGASIGFDEGIVLSTGDAMNVTGPNTVDNISAANGTPGDADLNALPSGYYTYDAAVLEFDFECSSSTVFSLTYVFGSEEYNEYVNSPYNDVFAFFLDGTAAGNNIATVPAGCGNVPGIPVSVNNVNCGNPYPGAGVNCGCYRNNDLSDGGGALDTEMDGLTQVFTRTVAITPGLHHMKIAIADVDDTLYDSDVFIACQSLVCSDPTPARKPSWGSLKTIYR
jgi:hypothetical protein